jgi:DNA mismatch repair protein MutH
MFRTANSAYLVIVQKAAVHFETENISHKTGSFIFRIPISGDLDCVRLAKHRIKNRLFWKPRREPSKPGASDQLELGSPYGSIKSDSGFRHYVEYPPQKEKANLISQTGLY